jgi:hypothetical protein
MLAAVLLVLLVCLMLDRHVSRRRARRLRRVADHCGFRYSSVDRFGLAPRIRPLLPQAASDVVVRDLMYRSAAGGYVYAFTAVYGGGRGQMVLHAREATSDATLLDVREGDKALSLGEQYRRLLHESTAAGA